MSAAGATTAATAGGRFVHLECARGVAAVCVLVFHFVEVFLPESAGPGGIRDLALLNPDFAVAFFFVLSGYVLSHRHYGTPALRPWLLAAIRRYPRLALPALASTAIAWLLVVSPLSLSAEHAARFGGAIGPLYANAGSPANIVEQGAVSAFIHGQASLNPVLWTMRIELAGSLLTFVLCWLAASCGRWRWLLYLASGIAIHAAGSFWYAGFLLGILLNEAVLARQALAAGLRRLVVGAAVLLAAGLSAYPTLGAALPVAPFYGKDSVLWRLLPAVDDPAVFWRVVAAWLLLWALIAAPGAARALSGTVSAWLGRLSFPLYLLHFPIIYTVGLATAAALHRYYRLPLSNYPLFVTICFVLTLVLTVVGSLAFYRWIDRPAVDLARRLAARIGGLGRG